MLPSVTPVSPVSDQVAVSASVMVVVAAIRCDQGDRRTRGAARVAQRNRVVFVAFHQPSSTAPKLMTRSLIDPAVRAAGVGQRAGCQRAEAQAGALYAVTAASTAATKSRVVGAGGGAVGESQMDRRRLARLQRAGQVHRVARHVLPSVTPVSPVSDQVAVSASVMVVMDRIGRRPVRSAAFVVLPGLLSATV